MNFGTGRRGIGERLALSFAGVVLLMLVGDAVSFWQLGRARARAGLDHRPNQFPLRISQVRRIRLRFARTHGQSH